MNAISIDGLSFGYKKGEKVLDNVSFNIQENSTTILLGKNGGGKSTLIKLIMGFLSPNEGSISISDKENAKLTVKERSKLVSYVKQEVSTQLDFLVSDFLLFGKANTTRIGFAPKKEYIAIMQQNAERLNITHLLGKTLTQLSGGEKQIVMICRALVQDSKIIILDEPLSALDFANQAKTLSLIKELSKLKKTIIFTTHNPNNALYLDGDVILLSNKKVIAKGSAKEVLTKEIVSDVYCIDIGFSQDHTYKEFSIK